MKEIGLNLYSVRNLIENESAFLDTATKLKEMGYSFMQYSGGPYDPDMIARVSQKAQMPICLTHVEMDRIIGDTDALMKEHEKFGCRYIGLGAMPHEAVLDFDLCKKTVEQLNTAGEKMAKNGFAFFYHHHNYEFFKHNGQTVFDYMIENAPYVNFTADTYWLQFGGVSVVDTLKRLKGRIACVHLKDYSQTYDYDIKRFVPTICPVGDGVLDFKAITSAMQSLGVEYYLVEQDNAAKMPDTLNQVKRSIDYIRKEL